jgi:hypothetical protein
MSKDKLLADFAAGYDRIKKALDEAPKAAWDFRPSPKAWTIREIVHHMPDSEASGYVRCRKIIAQSGVTVDVYDQEVWATNLKYASREVGLSLELFRLMRLYTLDLINTVDQKVWDDHFVIHPERGKLSLTHWLELYAVHADKHAGQIRRNVDAWEKAGRPTG